MKKNLIIWIIILISFVVIFVLVFRPIRSLKTMELIAKDKLMNEPFFLFTDTYVEDYKGIEGPIVTEMKERVKFTWYKVLDWGDTAKVSAYVYKFFLRDLNGMGLLFKDRKEPPDISANYQWYYVYVGDRNGKSSFADLIPDKYTVNSVNSLNYELSCKQNELEDLVFFIVNPNRLLFFLKKGYFFLMEKDYNYSIVDFYEPIAQKVDWQNNDTMSTMSTMSAKVFFIDSLEVFIVPNFAPIDSSQ